MPVWENHFTDVYYIDTSLVPANSFSNLGNHDYAFTNWECDINLNKDIELSEVTYHTSKAPNGKAAGTDGITAEALKTFFGEHFISYVHFSRRVSSFQSYPRVGRQRW